MILLAGFRSPMCIFIGSARDRKILYTFFQELAEYLERKNVSNRELITDRLYRRYVRFADLEDTFNIMKNIECDFIGENRIKRNEYQAFFSAFYKGVEEVRYLIEIGQKEEDENRFQTGLLELPYEVEEKLLPNKYYDDLPDDAEPVWMRTIPLEIESILEEYKEK